MYGEKKVVILSVRPEHLINILSHLKTYEMRLNVPKDYIGWVYLYCSKNAILEKSHLGFRVLNEREFYNYGIGKDISGMIVGRFWFNKYKVIIYDNMPYDNGYEDYDGNWVDNTTDAVGYFITNEQIKQLCVSYDTIEKYGKGKTLYLWEIGMVQQFERPLSLFYTYKDKVKTPITKAPMSYQYAYVGVDVNGDV